MFKDIYGLVVVMHFAIFYGVSLRERVLSACKNLELS